MPWEVSGVMEKRKQFLADYESGEWTMTDLCRAYEITRPTGYAVLQRYAGEGEAGRGVLSPAAKKQPHPKGVGYEETAPRLCRHNPRLGPPPFKEPPRRTNNQTG